MTRPEPRLLALLALTLAASACVPTSIERRTRVKQTAWTPAPTGPSAAGPMTSDGGFSLEGGARASHTIKGNTQLEQAQIGHVVMDRTLHGRAAMGVGRVELGVTGSYSRSHWASPTSDDRDPEDVEATRALWVGPQARVRLGGTAERGVVAIGELSVGNVPYARSITDETRVTFHTTDGDISSPPATTQRRQLHQQWMALYRAGLQAFFQPGERLFVSGGAIVQNAPVFFGEWTQSQSCRHTPGQGTACTEPTNPDALPASRMAMLVTPYVSLTLGEVRDGVSLSAQLYAHAAGDEVLRRTNPFGGDLTLRISF
ncbi:MAG: hypothetical protein AAGI01_00340 [Myxococcota bacterium]